jgi:hypothetical protein
MFYPVLVIIVMAGLDPAIQILRLHSLDGRLKGGHDHQESL